MKILKPDDPFFKNCEHEWKPIYENEPVNPNGEYVEGYGHTLVFKQIQVDGQCKNCGVLKSYLKI